MSVLVLRKGLPRWPALGQWAATPLAWSLLATAFLVIATLAGPGASLFDWLGDTDDAVRLVSVRDLLGGAPWFDTTLPRIGAPEPLVSHWSRLIDLPLAAMIGALTPLLGPERAELATRVAWPALLFLALALIVAREAHRRAGAVGAAFALMLVATSAVALAQFRPGRIDHHNAQILCAVAGLIFLVRSLDEKRAGWIAGCLLGLGLSIGYEAIALVVPALGLAALVAVWQSRQTSSTAGDGVVRAAAAAAATLFAALVVIVPTSRWLDVHCDALSLNLVLLAAFGAAGLWAAVAVKGRASIRLGLLGVGLAVGAGLYTGLEPACLAGPFGQSSPALKSLWLDHVMETKSIMWLAGSHPAAALATVGFVLAGAVAQIALWHRQRDTRSGLAAAIVVLAVVLGCWQIKLMPYACWLAAVPLAVWAAGLRGTASLSPAVVRLAAAVLLSQATLDAAFGALLSPFQGSGETSAAAAEAWDPRRACFRSANVRGLAALPPGLIAGDVDLGPYIVALSPHRVVAAPYHRLDRSILANHAITHGTPEQALRTLEALRVNYVALCADRPGGANSAGNGQAPTLGARLLDGDRFAFLQALDLPTDGAIRVWKVVPTR
jgi:Dolichyl-phosphate-mannose-protein mannosyltransferase